MIGTAPYRFTYLLAPRRLLVEQRIAKVRTRTVLSRGLSWVKRSNRWRRYPMLERLTRLR